MNIADYIDTAEAMRSVMFVVSGVLGMYYAYLVKWSRSDSKLGAHAYMFCNKKAAMTAVLTFVAMCVGAGGLSYLDTLTINQIIIAGAGIGLLVPQTVEQNKIK